MFLLTSVSMAEKNSLPVLKTEVKTLLIFKNGLGFFIRDGEVLLKDGWAVTEYVPNSTLGSIWISCMNKDATLEEVIAFKEEIKKKINAISIQSLLKANVGKKVIITLTDKTIEGTIKSVPGPKLATIVIIDTKDGEVVLNKNSISKLEFAESCTTEFLTEEEVKRIKFKVGTRKKKAKLNLSYLQKGISWVPSYLVNIEDPKRARITMKATVIDDVEDLKDVNLFFIVGYPNFIYADILSPMALEESLTQFIKALEQGGRRREVYDRLSNIMSQRDTFSGESARRPRSLDYGYAAIKGLPGASEEDLFLYNKKGVNLKKGERAYYHIFSDLVDYKNVYEWKIPDTIKVDPTGYYRPGQKEKVKEQVWHSIKLTNSTNYPWTTAPAFVISDWKPLAQDTINYTPKGTKTNLKLTVATDIKTDRHEYEMDRQRDVRLYSRSYDLVTVEGELYVKNCKTKDVTMELKKNLTGEVIEISHKGKVEKIADGLKGVNYNSSISWEIPLKAGKEINITYKYKVYIRH